MTVYRNDQWVQSAVGNAISGASIWYCTQPAQTGVIPPSPLAIVYSDPAGANQITQPIITDGFGHGFAYMAAGTYTVVIYSPQIGEVVLPDQIVTAPTISVPTVMQQSPAGAINSSNQVFTISTVPAVYITVYLNGVFQRPGNDYTFNGTTITMQVAPHTGSNLYCVYQ